MLSVEGGMGFGSVDKNLFMITWSHSLVMVIFWSFTYGIFVYGLLRYKNNSEVRLIAILSGLGVFSHWILDMLVHNNDMLLDPFSNPEIILPSLFIWQNPLVAFILESMLIIVLWWFYFHGLVFLLITHIIIYAPSFINAPPVEVDVLLGAGGIGLIFGVTTILTLVHKYSTKPES